MNIIFLCPSLDRTTGWNRYSYDVITRLAKDAHITVFCYTIDESVHSSIQQRPILRHPLSYLSHPLWVLLDTWKVRRAIRQCIRSGENNYVHSTVSAYAVFFPFLVGLHLRKIMTVHGTYSVLPLQSWKMRWLFLLVYKCVDRVISVSFYTKKHLLKHAGDALDASRVYVMTNGVDYEEKPLYQKKADEIFRIITVGGVKNRKGGHHLVRVAHLLKKKYSFPFTVTFIGTVEKEKPYYQQLTAYIHEHKLDKEVHFAGMVPQEELDVFYKTAGLFVLLSVHEGGHYEGYPLVFHEAAMWGVPTIGTYDCGAEDAIKHGETGFLVHPSNHESIADLIATLRNGDVMVSSKVCRDWARENDWSRKNLMDMYNFSSSFLSE